MHTEQQLIQRIARSLPCAPGAERVPIGPGDDAAAVALSRGSNIVVSCDAFIEGTHFLADAPADSAGYKSLVRAASDLTAMGARPEFFLLSLALPNAHTGRWLSGFLHGMGRAARQLKMSVIGGDTTRSRIIAVNITVLGEAISGDLVARSGAQPGDGIYVSGRLGGAKLALELIRRGLGNRRRFGAILKPYLYPTIRGQLGEWLGQNHIASALMDISDGISTDLARLCLASGVGARIWGERIPCVEVSPRIAAQMPGLRLNPLKMALHGGDDYELLFTVPPERKYKLRDAPEFLELTQIGEIMPGQSVLISDEDGNFRSLKPRGWDPFRKG